MAERSFVKEVEKLRLGAGEEFSGEGILAITKALLQCGVGYVGGYQGAPISHLMDVLADAQDILGELGVHFEASASEATATAMLAASVHYPIRGAATFKSTVGTNVASDALANLASGGVTGGALIIVGEDYGEGSSIMQERSHAFAMKSQVWLLDPRPNLPSIVKAVEDGFELSEASNTPVMLLVRIRCCHVHGHFTAKDNKRPPMTVADALSSPRRDTGRIVLPPASFLHEKEKVREALAGRGRLHPLAARSTSSSAPDRRLGRHRHAGRHVQCGHPRAAAPRPRRHLWRDRRAALCAQRRLSAGRRRVPVLLRGQGCGAGRRGRPAQLHRAGLRRDAAQGRARHQAGRQGASADGRRIYRPGHARRHRRLPARRGAAHAARRGARAEQDRQRRRHPRPRRRRARPSAGLLHRLPGAADLRRDKAGRAGARQAPHRLRHRLPSVLDHAALRARRHHHGLRPRAGLGLGLQLARREAPLDLLRRRRRLLAQRPDLLDRQRGLQQERRRHRHRRQFLFGRDRRAGHPVVARQQPLEIDQASDHRGGEGHGREMGAPHRPHLRCRQDAGRRCARR